MYLYECYYYENNYISKKITIDFYANSLQQAAHYITKKFNLSDYDLKISEEKRQHEYTSDYTLYKHTSKTTYFINQIA